MFVFLNYYNHSERDPIILSTKNEGVSENGHVNL